MKFDHSKFFAGVKTAWGGLRAAQVAALDALLNLFEADENMADIRWIAYALATVKHETADTYSPIAEYGKGKGRPYGKPDPETHQTYYGRGFVQLTWRKNYELFSEKLGVDLLNEPDAAMELETAYQILSIGMRKGLFTGKSLQNYIHGEVCDYINARRIINGTDRAALIAGYAEQFEEILNASQTQDDSSAVSVATTTTTTTTPPVTPASDTVVQQQSNTVITQIATSDTVKEIAKSGVTSIGARVSTSLAGGGLLAAIDSFVTQHWAGLIFAGGLILLAVCVVIFIMWHKHAQQQQAAAINANPGQHDISFK